MKRATGYLPTYNGCLICGKRNKNPAALQVRFFWDGEKVNTMVNPDESYNGYRGILHGGIISALLDEAMGWAAAVEKKCYFVTGELQIRFLNPAPSGEQLRVIAKCSEHKPRYSISEGELLNSSGIVLAKGKGKFFKIPYGRAVEIKKYLNFKPGDLDILVNPEEGAFHV